MSSIKQKLVIAFTAAALSSTALIADAMAECEVVKEDPDCWGDTCATKIVCTPGPAWTRESKKWNPPVESQGQASQGQASGAWLKKTQP